MSRHTDGRWKIVHDSKAGKVEICGKRKVERIAAMVHENTAVGQSNEVYANARLIACAPEMFSVLSEIFETLYIPDRKLRSRVAKIFTDLGEDCLPHEGEVLK